MSTFNVQNDKFLCTFYRQKKARKPLFKRIFELFRITMFLNLFESLLIFKML